MTSRPKITRIHLNDQTDAGFYFFGLVSTEADYKLSQSLNKKLSLSLKSIRPVSIEGNSEEKTSFSRYSFSSVTQEISYNLISNRSEKYFLLNKLKKIDYFFLIQDNGNYCNIEFITNSLREIEKVTAVFRLDTQEIRDKNLAYIIS
jgi:hypothetical protein